MRYQQVFKKHIFSKATDLANCVLLGGQILIPLSLPQEQELDSGQVSFLLPASLFPSANRDPGPSVLTSLGLLWRQ